MKYKYFVKYTGEDFETRGWHSDGETYEIISLIKNAVYPVNNVRGRDYVCTTDFLGVIPVGCSFYNENFIIV